MKIRIFSLVILLVAVMLFAVSCDTGGGVETPKPPEGDYIFAEGSELYLIHDGSDIATRQITSYTSRISELSGIIAKVRNAVDENAEHMLLLGDTGHPLSAAAMDILESGSLETDDGYAIYSDGKSLAIVWSCEYAATKAYEYFSENLCTGATLTMKKGESLAVAVDTAEHEAEILEAGFKVLEAELSEDAVTAIRKLYTLYTDDFYIWLANLWDPEVGAFYYSNSARDNEPFLPDIESTGQGLGILATAGMFVENGSWAKTLPEDIVDAIAKFAYDMQAEDGYFYHVQWGTNINISRRGRDLNRAASILSAAGVKPKYKLATDQIADDSELVSHLVTPLGRSAAVAVSRIVATADVDYLSSEEKFLAYLNSLDFANSSYASGHQLSSTKNQIKAAGLAEVCIKYLDERQNPENGFWEADVTYTSMNGFLKISSTYNGLGGKINHLDRAIDSIFEMLFSEEMPTTLPQLYNLTNGINNSLNNLKNQGDTELYDATRARVRENAAAIAETLYEKISTFRKDDGSFSYYVDSCAPTSQGCAVALKLDEGDVNAGSMAFHATSGFFKILGLPMPRIFTQYDAQTFCEMISNASPIDKIKLPPPEHTTYEDGILPGNTVLGLKAGELNIIKDPRTGGDYVMELVSHPDNSDSVRVNLAGMSSRVPTCFVYEADLCIARNEKDGTMLQINAGVYMINVKIAGDTASFIDCSLTSGNDRFTNDTGIKVKVGEWFTLRIEYYLGDADSVRIVLYLNGEKRFVSTNYYGGQPSLVDTVNEPKPIISNKGIMFFAMKASEITLLIDNVLVDSTDDVYVPEEGDLPEKPEATPMTDFDKLTELPSSVNESLQSGTLALVDDPREGKDGKVLAFTSAVGRFESFNVNRTYATSSVPNKYVFSADVCYSGFNTSGVASRIAIGTLYTLHMRHLGGGKISVRDDDGNELATVNENEWHSFGMSLTVLTATSAEVAVTLDGAVIATATVELTASANIPYVQFTTLKALCHTTYVDNVYLDAVSE